jgi:hypothetical protein
MKNCLILLFVGLLFQFCKKEKVVEAPPTIPSKTGSFIDTVSPTRYHSHDPLAVTLSPVYNRWKLYRISSIGIPHENTFHHLTLKKNGIYAITRNDSLLEYGGIMVNSNEVKFVPDKAQRSFFHSRTMIVRPSFPDSLVLQDAGYDGFVYFFVRN